MKQTLNTFTITPLGGSPAAVYARLAADQQFTASTGEVIPEGNAKTNYVEYTLAVLGNGRTFPAAVIDSTTDSTDPNATYTMYLMDSRRKEIGTLFERWMFDASLGVSFDYRTLEARNVHRLPLRDDQVYTKMQIDNLFLRRVPVSGTAVMTGGVAVIARTSMTADGQATGSALVPMSGVFHAEINPWVGFSIVSSDGGDEGLILWTAYDDLS